MPISSLLSKMAVHCSEKKQRNFTAFEQLFFHTMNKLSRKLHPSTPIISINWEILGKFPVQQWHSMANDYLYPARYKHVTLVYEAYYFYSFLIACSDFCRLMITFANSLDPDQD